LELNKSKYEEFTMGQDFIMLDMQTNVLFQNTTEKNKDLSYLFGLRKFLVDIGYVNKIQVNYSISNFEYVYEINHQFWETAYEKALQNKFQIAVSRGEVKYNTTLSKEDYDKSSIYERAVISNIEGDVFSQGIVIIKQFSLL